MANHEPDRSLLWPAVLVGIGVAGSLDEIVLHQLLRWHHLYDRGSQAAGLIADGSVHLGSTTAPVIGLAAVMLPGCFSSWWPVRRQRARKDRS